MVDDELLAFTPEAAARIAAVPVRRVRQWHDRRLVTPSIDRKLGPRRRVRLYGFQDMVELLVVRRLLELGIATVTIGRLLEYLRVNRGHDRPLSTLRFAVDTSGELYWQESDGQWEGGRKPGQLVVRETLDLEEIRALVRAHQARPPESVGEVTTRRGVARSRPVFAGTRTPVETLLPYFERGYSTARILESFPHLTPEDVDAARQMLVA